MADAVATFREYPGFGLPKPLDEALRIELGYHNQQNIDRKLSLYEYMQALLLIAVNEMRLARERAAAVAAEPAVQPAILPEMQRAAERLEEAKRGEPLVSA